MLTSDDIIMEAAMVDILVRNIDEETARRL